MRTRTGPLSFVALALVVSGVACKIDPKKAVVHYNLADATREVGPDGEPVVPLDVQDHIQGSLEMLFGTPSNPQFMRLKEWIDASYDPNWPSYAKEDNGGGEISAEDQEKRLWPDNERAFRRQLAMIEAGKYDQVVIAEQWAPDLMDKWGDLLAKTPPDKRDDAFKKEAHDLFVQWYPTLRDSSELYRQHCLHCHGPEGGGNGPTGNFLNPRPRDYRLGVFKFTPLKDKSVPRRADLFHILDEGVTGTAMPSFRRFSQAQLEGLVDYVRLLSMRGMVERQLVLDFKNNESLSAEDPIDEYKVVWEKWGKASEKFVAFEGDVPPPTPESIARGKELFMDAATGNCFSCHGPEGRGNGVSAFTTDPETGEVKSAYKDDWGRDILPRNLTLGIFRGGRRPIDIYRRIYSGINGTPMPALGESKKPDGSPLMSKSDLWAIVHYVGTLSERHEPLHAAAPAHTEEHAQH